MQSRSVGERRNVFGCEESEMLSVRGLLTPVLVSCTCDRNGLESGHECGCKNGCVNGRESGCESDHKSGHESGRDVDSRGLWICICGRWRVPQLVRPGIESQ